MSKFLAVKNYEKFQHYKDRNPPWIKLYNDLFDDYQFACLQDASKMHLIGIWLLASRLDNRIPHDEKWIAAKINATAKINLQELVTLGFIIVIDDASNMLADDKQSACLETEGETEVDYIQIKHTHETIQLSHIEDWLKEKNFKFDLEEEIEGFRIHYRKTGGKMNNGKPVTDWRAALQQWFNNAKKYRKENGTTQPNHGQNFNNGARKSQTAKIVDGINAVAAKYGTGNA